MNYALFFLLCVIGGTTYAAQKIGLAEGLPLWSAGMRFLIAGGILWMFSLYKRRFVWNKETVFSGIQYGILYFAIPFGIVYWLGQFLTSSLLSVLSSSVSVFAVIFNALFRNEKTTWRQLWGISLSMAGVGIVFLDSVFSYHAGMTGYLFIGIAAYCGAAYSTAFLKHKINGIDQNSFNLVALMTGGVVLTITSFLVEKGSRTFSGYGLYALLYLSLMGSVFSTKITTFLMGQWNVAKVTAYRFISPVISIGVGFLLWREKLSCNEMIGCVFIIVGVFVINRKAKQILQ